MSGIAHCLLHGVCPCDLDRLRHLHHVHPFTIDLVLVGILGINLIDVQIHHVRIDIGDAPGNGLVVADDDARVPREGKPGNLVGTIAACR